MTTKHKSPNKSSDDNQEIEVEEEAAKSADKEVVVVSEKSSNDDDKDDVGKTEDHKNPEVFQSKSNLEIVAWLVNHLEILRLALKMNKTDKNLKKYEKTASTGSLSQKELIDYVDEEFGYVKWKNLSTIKELDNITKELMIPSRSGNKIVDSLS
ncbi:14350_t:CDS:2, partial [Rhizophagus irregularis]